MKLMLVIGLMSLSSLSFAQTSNDIQDDMNKSFENMRKMMREQMKRMDSQMDQMMDQMMDDSQGKVLDLDSFNSDPLVEIKKSEHPGFILWQMDISKIDPKSLDVTVKDSVVSIKAERVEEITRESADGQTMKSYSRSSVYKSYPAPEGTNSEKVEIEKKEKVLTLKFPKDKSFRPTPRKATPQKNVKPLPPQKGILNI